MASEEAVTTTIGSGTINLTVTSNSVAQYASRAASTHTSSTNAPAARAAAATTSPQHTTSTVTAPQFDDIHVLVAALNVSVTHVVHHRQHIVPRRETLPAPVDRLEHVDAGHVVQGLVVLDEETSDSSNGVPPREGG